MTDIKIRKDKLYTKNKKHTLPNKVHVKNLLFTMVCVLSVLAAKDNIWLCVLPLVMMQIATAEISVYIAAVAAVVYYVSTFFATAYYVPCVAFVVVYLMGRYLLLGSRIKPVWFSVAVFAVGKLYVLSFGYESVYFAAFAVELVAVCFLPQIVTEGLQTVLTCRENLSPMQLCSTAAALLTIATALDAVRIYGLNLSVSFLFACAVYFILRSNIPLSLTAFICTAVAVCQDKNFSFLFIGFFVIYLGSSALLDKGEKGYLYTVFLAAAVSLLFVTRFNSFVFLTVTAVSLASAFVANKFLGPGINKNNVHTSNEKDYLQLVQKIDKLNQCFSFLGHTVIDISNLMAKEDIPKDVGDMVAQKLCRRCKNNMLCWQEHYNHTQKQFSSCGYNLQKGREISFDSQFQSRCGKTEQLREEFVQAYRLENAKQLISRSGRHNQKILQNQFLIISSVLQDISRQAANSGVVNTAFTYKLGNFLAAMGINADYCVCYHNKPRCVISARDSIEQKQLEKIKLKLEAMYTEKFAQPVVVQTDTEWIYSFCQQTQYICEFGLQSKSRMAVCGDTCQMFSTEEYTYLILADGMGTGAYASAESNTAVTMLQSLLSSGVKVPTALEITNTAINLKGTGQSCVAVDVLAVDCCSGNCTLYKAGGAAAWAVNNGRIKKLYKDSLPVGIMKETKIAQLQFGLDNGGYIIITSDGVEMCEELLCRTQLMAEKLSAEETAQYIIKDQNGEDDATVAVLQLLRR